MNKFFLGVVVFLLVSSMVASQAVIPDNVYQKVDSAIAGRAIPELNAVLAESSSASWYPRLESYVLKKTRQLVIQNDLETAKGASLALIDNNLDNREAVDLYQSITVAMEVQARTAEKQAEQAKLSEFKQKATETKIKQEAAKTYKTVTNTVTGKKVYLDQDFNNHYSTYTWDLMLGLANVGYLIDPEGSRARYGVEGNASLFWHGENFSAGVDAIGDIMLLAISGDPGVDWSAGGLVSVSSNAVGKYLELRGGYATFTYMYGSDDYEPFRFNTPLVGLGFRDVLLGKSTRFRMAVDYYPGYLSSDDILLALGGNLLLSFVLADMQDFDVHIQTGVRDTALLLDSGLKNDLKFVLAIGVANYE